METVVLVAVVLAGAVPAPASWALDVPDKDAPPADNTFPVPLPYEVGFDDTWGACRDGCRREHKGNDLMADEGTPVLAVEAGVIARVDNSDDGNGGLSVWLRGDSGVAYYYAHNSQNLVAEGDRVARGQVIARVGRTGNARSTPPHIHFQINVCGELSSSEPCTVDPHPFLLEWAQAEIDGGADGVGWYDPATGVVGTRTEVGSALGSFEVGAPGAPGVVPVAGDWDGDGRDSVGLYQRSDATFRLLDDEGAAMGQVAFGEPGREDVWPVAGDFDGDGRDTVGLYRQADATFVVLVVGGAESAPLALGTPGRADALPVVGDWDGDGRDSVGVYHRTDGSVLSLDDDATTLPPVDAGVAGPAAFPVAGDWDGDGRDTVGVLRPGPAAGGPVFDLPAGTPEDPDARRTVPADGGNADVFPVAGDWNGRDLVTLDELRQVFGAIPDEAKVAEGLPALNAAMAQAGITTPARKAAFLATLRSESGFRYDAVEAGNDNRYRGRGYIQLTGEHNYRQAGDDLALGLVDDLERAIDSQASPAIAAWYWTVARDVNTAADRLDMAAVNYAVGFAPSDRRDMVRCSDFLAALRFYTGQSAVEGVNCERTPGSRRLGLRPGASRRDSGDRGGSSTPAGIVASSSAETPAGWASPSPGTTAPPGSTGATNAGSPGPAHTPNATAAPPTSPTTGAPPSATSSTTTLPPTTSPPSTATDPAPTTSQEPAAMPATSSPSTATP